LPNPGYAARRGTRRSRACPSRRYTARRAARDWMARPSLPRARLRLCPRWKSVRRELPQHGQGATPSRVAEGLAQRRAPRRIVPVAAEVEPRASCFWVADSRTRLLRRHSPLVRASYSSPTAPRGSRRVLAHMGPRSVPCPVWSPSERARRLGPRGPPLQGGFFFLRAVILLIACCQGSNIQPSFCVSFF
jgi:hypothetical protein